MDEEEKQFAAVSLTFTNITNIALDEAKIDFLVFFRGESIGSRRVPIELVDETGKIEPGQTITHEVRIDVTEFFEDIQSVRWLFSINNVLVLHDDIRPEEDRDELTPADLVLFSERLTPDVWPDGRHFVVGRGVVKNVSERELVDVQVLYRFLDDNNEVLDFVYAWVVNEDGEQILEPGATARYSFRQGVSSWAAGSFQSTIQFQTSDMELRHVKR